MPLDFPNSPIANDLYTFNGRTWKYNGEAWDLQPQVNPQGTQGLQGLGNQGTQGTQGRQGLQGLQGLQGVGAQGLQGAQGVQGLSNQGAQGRQGTQGVGAQGTQGLQGVQGLSNQGTQGPAGTTQGSQGTQGTQGVQGLSNQGVQGNQGIQGLSNQGTQGNQGRQGTQGLSNQGVQGLQGGLSAQGNQGTQGVGAQGAQGTQGIQGGLSAQGNQGVQGISNQGAQGLQGGLSAQGAQGTQGRQGTQGLSNQGAQGLQGGLSAQGAQGTQGTQGFTGPPGAVSSAVNILSTTSPYFLGFSSVSSGIITAIFTSPTITVSGLGSVGIGTTNPTEPLDVAGDLRIRGGLYDFNNIVGTAGSILVSTGAGVSWSSSVSSSSLLSSDDTTTTSLYPVLVGTVGIVTAVKTTSSKLSFNASTGELTAVSYNSTSDLSLKENIEPLSGSIDILRRLTPVKFSWKDNGKISYGLIAQELEKILPELVAQENETKSVSYIPLISLLIDAVVSLSDEIKSMRE